MLLLEQLCFKKKKNQVCPFISLRVAYVQIILSLMIVSYMNICPWQLCQMFVEFFTLQYQLYTTIGYKQTNKSVSCILGNSTGAGCK